MAEKVIKTAVFFADGTEELEGLTPVDVIKRAGAVCDIVSVGGQILTGSHGIKIVADKLIEDISFEDYDAFIVPGGMPGAVNISENERAIDILKKAKINNKLIASICASPAVVLAKHGLLNKRATCYNFSDFVSMLSDTYTGSRVEVDGNVITADGPKSAFDFALEICKALNITPKF